MFRISSRAVALASLSLWLNACGGGGGGEPEPLKPADTTPSTVSISPTSVTLGTWGGTQQLTVEVRNAAGEGVSASQVQWSSSAPGVVQVSSTGKLTGVRAGQATITAKAGDVTAQATVTAGQLNPACIAPTGTPVKKAAAAAPTFTQTEPQSMARPVYNPAFVVPVDYDKDGDQDLVIAETSYPGNVPYDARIATFRNDSGTLVDTTTTAFVGTGKPDHARDFEVADFDGDGRMDIYFANHGYDAPPFPGAPNLLLLGDATGGGRFVDASDRFGSNPASFTHASASGDVDCDGDVDLYEGNAFEGSASAPMPAPRLLLNDGTAHFTSRPTSLPGFINTYARKFLSAELCDVDRDGDGDLMLGGFSGASELLMNDGSGNFAVSPIAMLPADVFSTGQDIEARCVDVDLDGWQDLVMLALDKPFTDANGPVQRRQLVWRNKGDGTFEDVTAAWMPTLQNTGFMVNLRPVDLNKDGWMDLVLSGGESGADKGMLVNDGTKFVFTQVANQYGDTYGEALFELDVNGDGKLDLYQPRTNYTPAIYVQN
jgi:hypothetical protein